MLRGVGGMEAEAEITLIYNCDEEASAIFKSVSPDNQTCPEGLEVKTWLEGKKVITFIRCCCENIATFMSTIDDLLSCVTTAEKILSALKKK